MGKELELKFLLEENATTYETPFFSQIYGSVAQVKLDVLKRGEPYHQGYLPHETWANAITYFDVSVDFDPVEVRVRQKGSLHPAYEFTVKGDGTMERDEVELDIDFAGFHKYWGETLGRRIEKTRLKLPGGDGKVELDVYRDRDLFVAEIEFANKQLVSRFPALGQNITEDKLYKNKNLAR